MEAVYQAMSTELEQFYNSKDRKILISLLTEYSDKVLKICDRIEQGKHNISIIILTLMWLTVVGISSVIFSHLNAINPNIKLLIFVLLLATFHVIHYPINQRLKLLRRDAKTFSIRLEKIVRLASQIEEHNVTNLVSRIELDLRIADAESALAHYESVENKGILSKFFNFFY
jgi:hypothetical protein